MRLRGRANGCALHHFQERVRVARRGQTESPNKFFYRAVIDAALESRFDKCHDFQRDTDVDRRSLSLKEFHDLLEEIAVGITSAQGNIHDPGVGKGEKSVIALACSDAPDSRKPAVLPLTRDDIRVLLVRAGHSPASRPHDGI